MNRAININISGQLFFINDDAYAKLNTYLKTIGGYFDDKNGKEEIMTDIEARIAEMFQEKLTDRNQVIVMRDIDEVIKVMGNPEDFREVGDQESFIDNDESKGYSSKRKRLFRDDDNRVIGGVCSGIGAYFDVDTVWIRIVFVAMFFLFGTGPLLYIILWIIIPKAISPTEKLEMRGEPININNISKAITEEFDGLKKKYENLKNHKKRNSFSDQVRDFLKEIADLIIRTFGALFKLIGRFIGLILIAVAISLLLVLGLLLGSDLFVSINSVEINSINISEFLSVFFPSDFYYKYAKLSLFLLLAVPIITLIIGGIKLLFGIRKKTKYLSSFLGTLWGVGILIALFVFYFVIQEYKVNSITSNTIILKQPEDKTLFIDVNQDVFDREKNKQYERGEWYLIKPENESIYFGNVRFDIKKSESNNFELEIIKSSRGATQKDAINKAENILYTFSQTDSLLLLDPYYKISQKDKIRWQRVQLILKIPEGKSVFLDSKMTRIIYDIDNYTNTKDEKMGGHNWLMDRNDLKCTDC